MNLHEALDVFEENIPEIKKAAEENMQYELSQLKQPRPNTNANLFWVKANTYLLDKQVIVKKYNPILKAISMKVQPKRKDTIGTTEVQRARSVPLETLLLEPPVRGMARCPIHNERTASFQIKKNNTFTCYGCQQFGDTIDLYQKLHKCDFITAVKALQ